MKHRNEIAVLTFVYEAVKPYFLDFLESMEKQSNKNFDLVIVNDGFVELTSFLNSYPRLNYIVIDSKRTPSKNREAGLNLIREFGYKYCVMADSDDFFSDNRIEESYNSLQISDIVVNELSITDSKGKVLIDTYFHGKLKTGDSINFNFLKNKNCLGFSNTAFHTCLIPYDFSIPEGLKIVDWYFYSLLLYNGYSVVFNNKAITYYRQSDNNIIGINNVDEEIYRKRYHLKYEHYYYLSKKIPEMKTIAESYSEDESTFCRHYDAFRKHRYDKPFWWEEI